MKKLVASVILSLMPLAAVAQQPEGATEPKIVIRQLEDRVIHEYSINGFVYAIKVVPKNGKPYYLVAEDGGNYMRVDEPKMLIPQWKIFTW